MTAVTRFEDRLAGAVADSGLSLHRLRQLLGERDLEVSIATLSYWSTGRSRPTRGRSLDVVRGLEQILGLESGWLVSALPVDEKQSLVRSSALVQQLADLGMPRTDLWHTDLVHQRTLLDATGCDREVVTTMVMRARMAQAQGWTMVLESEDHDGAHFEPLAGLTVARTERLPGGLVAAELRTPRPLRRGEATMCSFRTLLGPCSTPATSYSYTVQRQLGLLVAEVVFGGREPQGVELDFRPPDSELATPGAQPVSVERTRAVVSLVNPAPGTHRLRWQW